MRYHKDIGFPSTLIFPSKVGKLIYTDHALEKGLNISFYGWIHGIRKIKPETIVEVITDDDVTVKEIVLRLPYQKGLDANFALELKANSGIVKTIWLNRKKDTHQTLDKSIYDKPKTKSCANSLPSSA
jgi:hypothetical protein